MGTARLLGSLLRARRHGRDDGVIFFNKILDTIANAVNANDLNEGLYVLFAERAKNTSLDFEWFRHKNMFDVIFAIHQYNFDKPIITVKFSYR